MYKGALYRIHSLQYHSAGKWVMADTHKILWFISYGRNAVLNEMYHLLDKCDCIYNFPHGQWQMHNSVYLDKLPLPCSRMFVYTTGAIFNCGSPFAPFSHTALDAICTRYWFYRIKDFHIQYELYTRYDCRLICEVTCKRENVLKTVSSDMLPS